MNSLRIYTAAMAVCAQMASAAPAVAAPAPIVTRGATTDGPFLSWIDGKTLPGTDAACQDFILTGPFTSFHIGMGWDGIGSISAESIGGNSTTIDPAGGSGEVPGGVFEYLTSERITNFAVGKDPNGVIASIAFETEAGTQHTALTDSLRRGETTGVTFENIPTGSGVLARIRGTSCDATGQLGSIGFDFLDVLDSTVITNINYEGFTDDIMNADIGVPLSVGSISTDNRNGSTIARVTLLAQEANTWQRTITVTGTLTIGMTVTVGGKVGVPLVAEGTVSVAARWDLAASLSRADTVASTSTRAGTFWLDCPAQTFCTAECFYMMYHMDTNINATMTATTITGATFSWMQSGKYDTTDSLALQFKINEQNADGNRAADGSGALITPATDGTAESAADAIGSGTTTPGR